MPPKGWWWEFRVHGGYGAELLVYKLQVSDSPPTQPYHIRTYKKTLGKIMKKIAYPWIDGHDQSSDLSNYPMDDMVEKKDTASSWYDTFSLTPAGGESNNLQPVTTYSAGIISPEILLMIAAKPAVNHA